jgi:hypothetical protein
VKGRTAMQAACNRTKGAHPFDFDASSMEAQAHTSCNRRAGYYVRETAPPLAPVPRLLDCGTGAATRGDPAHDPTVPTEHISHGSVSRGRRRDGRYGQKWAGSNGGGRRTEAAVKSSQAHVPSWGSRRTLSHDVKTTRPCTVPRTARTRTTAAPRTTRPVAIPLRTFGRRSRRCFTSAIMTTSKKVCHIVQFRILFHFLFLSIATGTGKGDTPKGILLREGSGPRAPY